MDAIAAIRTRRSVRSFLNRALDVQLVEALLSDAAHAPFSPDAIGGAWHFTAILGRARLAGYGKRALAFVRENRPRQCGYEWSERAGFSIFHGAPAAVVISGQTGLASALEECARAGQMFEISAHARGLGVCWLVAPMMWLRDPSTSAEMCVPEGWMPHACIVLGWPDDAEPELPPPLRPPHLVNWVG